ncbi:hypothetical protein psyc5s11_36440 [Clostridium gelidum]|uniref:Uncharacterized protein n=1 Tax=Clostridium gelidum TaxID=704125 RepID=A0ABN6J021_9CLOT|nr:hypothetical protein [Clostridium gelidum]BCZ47577.1 hypothetical protein psyc5s11_36440 [Clostridium gelidum]
MNTGILKYIENCEYKIYKKNLQHKCRGSYQNYYFVVKETKIIDVFWEKEVNEVIKERLSYNNIDLIVYKVVERINDKYFSFWNNNHIEYIVNEELKCHTEQGFFFCKSIEQAKNENFSNRTDISKLKAKVKIDDLIGGNLRDLQFSRCIPIEIID